MQRPEILSKVEILYRDDDLIAAFKPSGLLVHPYREAIGVKECLLKEVRRLTGQFLYPIHRLDRPVSGIVLFGLSSLIVKEIKSEWSNSGNIKEYITLVRGVLNEPGKFNFPLGNEQKIKQEAETHYWPLHQFEEMTLVKVRILTGRKHQIRRHFSRRMHQIIGDTGYGKGPINQVFRSEYGMNRIFLHAHYLRIFNPVKENYQEFHSPLPDDLVLVLNKLGLPNYLEVLNKSSELGPICEE